MMRRLPLDLCLQAGDYYCYGERWPIPVYWIQGNHEDPDVVGPLREAGEIREIATNNFYLPGGRHEIEGVVVVALPGMFQWRHEAGPALFYEDDYEACWSAADEGPVDILISHDCGYPFPIMVGRTVKNVENERITELIDHLQPTYAVSGHNHVYEVQDVGATRLIRLADEGAGFCHQIEVGVEVQDEADNLPVR